MSSRAAQQAQWLLWQMNAVEEVAAPVHTAVFAPEAPHVPAIPHRRYDAVVQRMQQARQRTGTYNAWPGQPGTTMQPASGSPKAEK